MSSEAISPFQSSMYKWLGVKVDKDTNPTPQQKSVVKAIELLHKDNFNINITTNLNNYDYNNNKTPVYAAKLQSPCGKDLYSKKYGICTLRYGRDDGYGSSPYESVKAMLTDLPTDKCTDDLAATTDPDNSWGKKFNLPKFEIIA